MTFLLFFCLQSLKYLDSYAWTPSTKKAQLSTLNKILWMKRAVILLCYYYIFSQWLSSVLGGNLNAASRQALMQKLARTESAPSVPESMWRCILFLQSFTNSKCSARPNIPQAMQSRSVLLKDMFDPEELVFLIINTLYLIFLQSEKVNVIGTRISPKMLKGNARASMVL